MKWLNKLITEFKHRVLECHYRLVEFNKKESKEKWWEIQRLDLLGWKCIDIHYTKEDADKCLILYANMLVAPTTKVLKMT